jgi:hypothetical protein
VKVIGDGSMEEGGKLETNTKRRRRRRRKEKTFALK